MKRAVKWLRRGAFGLGIAAALAFGGHQAFAAPTAAAPCDWDLPDWGPCETTYECHLRCNTDFFPVEYQGFCVTGCCICIEL